MLLAEAECIEPGANVLVCSRETWARRPFWDAGLTGIIWDDECPYGMLYFINPETFF